MKKVLITGAGGFVAGHLIDILKNDYSIIGLVHNREQKLIDGVQFVKGDILDKSFLTNLISEEKPEIIVHMAAITRAWSDDYANLFQTNLIGTLNLYEAVVSEKKQGSYDPKILFISSADVYGKSANPENIQETDTFNPISFYASSKVAADRLSYMYAQTDQLNTVIVRPFTHIGPGQGKGFFCSDMAFQISDIEKGQNPDKVIMVGNLDSYRECIDVRDVVQAYKLLIETETRGGEAFNLGTGKTYQMKDLLDKLLSLSTEKIETKQDPTRLRKSDIPINANGSSKLKEVTGWEPQISIDQTLEDVLDFWRSQN